MTEPGALALTLAIEVPLVSLALVALRLACPCGAILLAAGVNLLTQPPLWWVLSRHPGPDAFWLAETAVCTIEAGLMWLVVRRRDLPLLLVVSVGANAVSVAAGVLVSGVGG